MRYVYIRAVWWSGRHEKGVKAKGMQEGRMEGQMEEWAARMLDARQDGKRMERNDNLKDERTGWKVCI